MIDLIGFCSGVFFGGGFILLVAIFLDRKDRLYKVAGGGK